MNLSTPCPTSAGMQATVLPLALLLDMDGTLTRPMLDFPRIKAEMGIGPQPILEALASMTPERRQSAEQVLHRHETEAAEKSILNPGCRELLNWLRAHQIAMAVITRNSRASVKTLCRRHDLRFAVLIAREDGRFKPHPEPLLRACDRLGVAPSHSWMVGDGQYDVEAGNAAGTPTIWISHGSEKPFAAAPWRTAADLIELTRMLEGCLT